MGRLSDLIFRKKYGFWHKNYEKMPEGWRKAFGKQLSNDLLKIVKKCKLKNFGVIQVARSYGMLIIRYENGNTLIDYLLRQYSMKSLGYCIYCGEPVRYHYKNLYMCRNCFKEKYSDKVKDYKTRRVLLTQCKVKVHDLPENTYDVDLRELWGLRKHTAIAD